MASFALAVYGSPHSSQSSYQALRFCQSAITQGHSILRVFFYHEGVYTASLLNTPAQDEFDLSYEWRVLAQAHKLDLVVCIASALKRGLLDEAEARRYKKSGENLAPEFAISGLGQLLDAAVTADRFITFGS
jgi:tRNA 2-thiouridine synthesizing protein D